MQPVIPAVTEWKLDKFIETGPNNLPVDTLSVNQKVWRLLKRHQSVVESHESGWVGLLSDARDEASNGSTVYRVGHKYSRNEAVPDFDGESRRPLIDDDLADEIEEEVAEMVGSVQGLSFAQQLDVLLEEYNNYASYLNVGWGESTDENPPIEKENEIQATALRQ